MKEKQIEEMAKTMLEESQKANVEPVLEMEGKEVVLGENATKVLDNILEQAFIPFLAEVLYNTGYRKASEVAREIFEEIDILIVRRMIPDAALIDDRLITDIAELKKKYTEGESTQVVYKHYTPDGATYITTEPISAESEDTE